MEFLIKRLSPAVIDILKEKEPNHAYTIGELFEHLETERYWKEIPYYVLETLMVHIYGFEAPDVTESKMEILFEGDE